MSRSRYQPYPEYKETGMEWLNVIPNAWETKKLKFVAKVQASNVDKKSKEGEQPVLLCNYTDVYYNDSIDDSMEFMKATATEDQIKKFCLREGDTIITKDSEDPTDIAVPAYISKDLPRVICGYHLSIIRPNPGQCGAYLKKVFECAFSKAYFTTRSNGLTRYGLGSHPLQNVVFPIPPLPEQTQIAKFLDHETAKIDRLIEKQRELIALLKEKRQAVISHAVTKGLNPQAKMKDSGVEWLGEVPEHWEVGRVGFYATKIGSGKTPRGGSEVYQEEGILFLRSQNIHNNGLRAGSAESVYIAESVHKEMKGTAVKNGDVLLNITGGSIGRTCIVPSGFPTANVNQHVCIIRFPNFIRDFMSWAMKSHLVQDQINFMQNGGNREGLNFEQISNLLVLLPPRKQCNEIVGYIKNSIEKYDYLEGRSIEAINLLQERRTALISAAVTGKIDVRDWQPPSGEDSASIN